MSYLIELIQESNPGMSYQEIEDILNYEPFPALHEESADDVDQLINMYICVEE